MGGGVGGLLYSARNSGAGSPPSALSSTLKYNLSNGRGDIVAQSDSTGTLTWTASYEAYGKRTKETGTNADKQRANTKDEDPTGLLNEGFRYRDIETGVWLSRDPAGFVDGPNLYAYVKQNAWTAFDPHGLAASSTSGDGKPQQDGKQVHQEFPGTRGGKPTAMVTSSAKKVITDSLVITETEVRPNELKPLSRLLNPAKLRAALRQLGDQMDAAANSAISDGKKIVGELWGWSKVNGKTVFTKVQEVAGKNKGKIGAAITLATASTSEGGIVEGLSDSLTPHVKAALNSGESGVVPYAEAVFKDVATNMDPGVSLVANRQNAAAAGRGFWNAVSAGSGNDTDFSQSTKYDMKGGVSEMWNGLKDYLTSK
jgi:RHS repeat-associated protein